MKNVSLNGGEKVETEKKRARKPETDDCCLDLFQLDESFELVVHCGDS